MAKPTDLRHLILTLAALGLAACSAGTPEPQQEAARPPPRYDQVPRPAFNARAAALALPLFWSADKNGDQRVDPDEVWTIFGMQGSDRAEWVTAAGFTARFSTAYEQIVRTATQAIEIPAAEGEARRRALVRAELAQSRPTLISNDFSQGSAEDRALVRRLDRVATMIDQLFMTQRGSWGLMTQLPADDPASHLLFFRNQGPWCEAPATQSEKECHAIPARPAEISGVYPASLQGEGKDVCKATQGVLKNDYGDHFAVVALEGDKPVALPYPKAYAGQMEAIAKELEAGANEITSAEEAALKAYLLAAAQAFRDNDWQKADEAWVGMNAKNSKWYLRVGPDEVYWEPCAIRAGFHLSFGSIDKRSLEWQATLDPFKDEMEKEIAKLAGAPYRARNVSFQLPDFTEIVINAGDSRAPSGATIGQSLPNWGKIREEGRGRTVAMTNFYTDQDSIDALKSQASSLLCKSAMAAFTPDPSAALMSVVLHEAAHNLGPAGEYRVGGKTDEEALGGQLASMYEELKAQTAALFYTDWLVTKNVITQSQADQSHTRDLIWAFGHISRGMYDSDHGIKPYSQLAMVQLGYLMKEKALTWNAGELADNGRDQGCFALDLSTLAPAVKKMMTTVGQVKAKYDKKRGEALRAEFVDDKGVYAKAREVITERMLRSPKPSFVYSVRY